MALLAPSNDAFVRIIGEYNKRFGLLHKHGVVIISHGHGMVDLVLVDVSSGDGRTLKEMRRTDGVPPSDVLSRIVELHVKGKVSGLSPVFLDCECSDKQNGFRRCWELIDPATMQPIQIDGKPIVVGYVPTIC